MKANFKPTLLASVIAAAIYAPAAQAADVKCSNEINSPRDPISLGGDTYNHVPPSPPTDPTNYNCYINGQKEVWQQAGTLINGIGSGTFNVNIISAKDGSSEPFLSARKGLVLLGQNDNTSIEFNKDLTLTYTNADVNADSEGSSWGPKTSTIYRGKGTNAILVANRHKTTSAGNGGITLNGNNTLTVTTDDSGTKKNEVPYFYTGAAIENYGTFAINEGKDTLDNAFTTTIKNTGRVNGINQYTGKLTIGQPLTIESNIALPSIKSGLGHDRLSAAILIAGVGDENNNTASQNEVTFADVKITESGAGHGIVSKSYQAARAIYSYDNNVAKLVAGGTTVKSDFTGSLNITHQGSTGSAIVLATGGINHTKKDTDLSDQKKATITVNGKGHGIEVPADAGVLGDHTTTSPSYSEFNFVSLAGGTFGKDDKGKNKLAISLGKNATITTTDKDSDGINIANVPEGNINTIVIHNKGKIHAKGSDADAIDLSAMNSPSKTTNPDLDSIRKITITNDKGSLLADSGYLLKGSAYNETFKSTDGELKGKIGMGDGSDNVTITGSDISGVTLFDGGDDTEAGDTFIDTLTLNNVTYTDDGTKIIKWENITLGDKTTLNLTGNLTVGTGTEKITTEQASGLTINNGARLNVGTDAAPDVTIEGKVTNSGTIDLSANDPKPVQKLTIKGDYTGNNGTIIFDGLLKDDVNSKADSLTIEGNTDGKTNVVVKPTNPGDTGGATNQGIKLISVGGNSNQSHFTLQNPVQLTAYEYNILHYNPSNKVFFLQSKKNPSGGKKPVEGGKPKPAGSGNSNNANTTHSNTAYKPVDKPSKKIPDSVDTTPIPDVNNGNGSGSYKPELYRPAVATYSMVQFSNQDAINSLLGDQLHQRVGEQEVLRWDDKEAHDNQVWGRIRHNQLKLNGKKQFEVKQNTQLVQFGWDLDVHRNDQNSRQHSGLFAGFARANAEVSDRDRAFTEYGAFSGKVKGDIFNIGAYHTRYDEQGNYLDVIGGVHFVGNQYNDVYGSSSKQRGWGLSASVEGGMPFAIGDSEHWFVEPQAQLSWQMTQYKKFDDAVTSIDGYTSQSLRPRLGVRVGYNDKSANPEQRSKDFYATASFVRELLDPAKVNIGGVNVTEKVNNDTWVEVGLGGQLPIGKSTYIYGSAQYQHTIGSDARSGVNGQIGVRYSW